MRNTNREPVSVGSILKTEFLDPLSISESKLAGAIGIDKSAVDGLISGEITINPEIAAKLAIALGTTPDFWLNIQHGVDSWKSNNSLDMARLSVKVLVN
ncbi:HigA family addiction module antitoxin [Vibrio parahaemolyticus]|uniref:HigA family addiction module antitoxin n=1 Tax=Vibrio parahaemolyticus TaxID=670 RepID=UPI000B64AA56|nr:HigA family addiction module antitoxin [Vibrio parahaemolyticus]OUD22231.1 addiction module antidote protein, HigA family [Vibrio parahaemolyticus]HCE1714505.1 HigA family addiction module antidote protein [Vibrio parahaemolyticus]HCE2253718.1 HigA family addiction module antidote protein [Vibrio parahaemolyticus]HCE3131155.1 HigA family addiction module antidote protein [Vibrio parahaemolyticus]HCG5976483.1 HigA family addiction module antidote protein [Vibrio parahaemolyticus]